MLVSVHVGPAAAGGPGVAAACAGVVGACPAALPTPVGFGVCCPAVHVVGGDAGATLVVRW